MIEEITKLEADDLLEMISEYERKIKTAEDEFNEFKAHYEKKITAAKKDCEEQCKIPRQEIAILTEKLRQFAEKNLPKGRQSIKLPSGTLSFHKKEPKFFIGGQAANAQNKVLLEFVKTNAPEFVKTAEYVDWSGFKTKLSVEDDAIYFKETGELVDGLQIENYPDTFTVKTK